MKTVVRISIISMSIGVSLGVLVGAPAQATSPTPKVGNCYNLTNKQVDRAYAPNSTAINCARLHNAETYRVAK